MTPIAEPDRIAELAEKVGELVPTLILDLRDKIDEAITAAVEESQDAAEETREGKPAVLSLPVAIKWNLDTRAVEVVAGVAVRWKAKGTVELDDPEQPKLPGIESVTIHTPGVEPVTVTGEQFARAGRRGGGRVSAKQAKAIVEEAENAGGAA